MNWRTGVANASVLAAAARLIAARSLSYRDVYDARLAFDLYDHEQDHEGIFLKDLHNLSRALKLCQRALGPVQLRSELRRVTGSPVMPSRIQLHEFLQLLLSCAPLVTPTVHNVGSVEKDQRDLYRLADFRKMLTPEDRQRQQTLDAQRHWVLARIKLNIKSTIVRDLVDRRNVPQTRAWEVDKEVDVSREVGKWGASIVNSCFHSCNIRAVSMDLPTSPIAPPTFLRFSKSSHPKFAFRIYSDGCTSRSARWQGRARAGQCRRRYSRLSLRRSTHPSQPNGIISAGGLLGPILLQSEE